MGVCVCLKLKYISYIHIEREVFCNITVAFLAQSVERAALNRAVVGSRPTGGVLFLEKKIVSDIVKEKKQRKNKRTKKEKKKLQKRRFRLGSNQGPIG